MTGRILGLDPGERRIGVALSDPTGTIAMPLTVIDTKKTDFETELIAICVGNDVRKIVVGLPVTLAGTEGASAAMARRIAAEAAAASGLRVEMHDERLTSVIADKALLEGDVDRRRRRDTRDKVAAAILLQAYLDGRKRREHPSNGDPART